VLCIRNSWNKMLARIKQLAPPAVVAELFYQDQFGGSAFALASAYKAPVEVLQSMLRLAKLDAGAAREHGRAGQAGRQEEEHCVGSRLEGPVYSVARKSIHRTDAAAIELLARDHPGSQHAALDVILGVNKKN